MPVLVWHGSICRTSGPWGERLVQGTWVLTCQLDTALYWEVKGRGKERVNWWEITRIAVRLPGTSVRLSGKDPLGAAAGAKDVDRPHADMPQSRGKRDWRRTDWNRRRQGHVKARKGDGS
jgi:hypothetical protein